MVEAALAALGAWFYAALLIILHSFAPCWLLTFLGGYLFVATLDLWRCWRAVRWRRATPLEVAVAAFFLFPIASALWMPWDLGRVFNSGRS